MSVYYRSLVMAEQGAQIDLLTYGCGKDVHIPGVRVIRIPRLKFLEPVPVGPSWRKLLLDVFMIAWTFGLLARRRYAVVAAHEEAVFWCRFLKPVFRFRLIYEMHSSLPKQLQNFRFTTSRFLIRVFERLESSCVRAADATVTICPDLSSYAASLGASPDRILLIENSIIDEVCVQEVSMDALPIHEPVNFRPGRPVILYAGSFEAYQGVEILVEAFAAVVRRLPDARLLLVGGTDRQIAKIRELADLLGVGDTSILTGHVPRKIAVEYMRSAQVVVSLRLHGTNTPLKIYELLASGRPMVATRVWAHTQILDDEICFLANPNAESLAGSLLQALQDEAESARRVKSALSKFTREYTRAAYEAKVRRLLKMVT